MLGRSLKKGEDVHHINGKPDDNREKNLRVMPHGEHLRVHLSKLYGKSNEIINLFQKGYSMRAIGRRFGIHHTNVAVFLRLHLGDDLKGFTNV